MIPIHSMFYNFVGVNFLGKLHNTKQHIQFIQFIKDNLTIPIHILSQFFTSYGGFQGNFTHCEDMRLLPMKKEHIKRQFDECEWYIFEISSIKLYKNSGFEVQPEVSNNYNCVIQTEEELLEYLHTIRALLPSHKKILFQVHFRPNIIYNDANKTIENREIIYKVIKRFCEKNENTFIYDPSTLLKTNHSLFDGDTHFTMSGHIESFNYIYVNYLLSTNTS